MRKVMATWKEPTGWPDVPDREHQVEILQFIYDPNYLPGYTLGGAEPRIIAMVVDGEGKLRKAEPRHLTVLPDEPSLTLAWDLAKEAATAGIATYRVNDAGEIERVELRD